MLFWDNELAWNVLMFLYQFRRSGYIKINACRIILTHVPRCSNRPSSVTENLSHICILPLKLPVRKTKAVCFRVSNPTQEPSPNHQHTFYLSILYENSIIWTSEGSDGKWEQDGLVLSQRKSAMMKAHETENQVLVQYPRRCSWSRLHLGSECWARICFLTSGLIANWFHFLYFWIELLTITKEPWGKNIYVLW